MAFNKRKAFIIVFVLMVIGIITFLILSFMSILKIKKSASNKNVIAFLKMVRVGEGTSGPNGYRTLFGGGLFNDYSKHPNKKVTAGGYTSTAAGAYQFLYGTWLECQKALSLPDFSINSQDLAAIYLLQKRGALDDIINGNLKQAVQKCAPEWASLPVTETFTDSKGKTRIAGNSYYGQPVVSYESIKSNYKEYGGSLTA